MRRDLLGERGAAPPRATGRCETGTPPNDSISSGFVSALASVPGERPFSTTAGDLETPAPHRLEREERVVDGAEPRAGDDEERQPEPAGEIGDRPVLADRNEQPAGALDESTSWRAPRAPRRTRRCPRARATVPSSRAATSGASGAAKEYGQISSGVLVRRQPHAAAWRRPRDRRQGAALDRLRDADVETGGREQPGEAAVTTVLPTSVSVAVTKSPSSRLGPRGRPARGSRASRRGRRSVASGGRNVTTSPSGRVTTPSLAGAAADPRAHSRASSRRAPCDSRSATSSMPTMKPRWRTSPTCGNAARRPARPAAPPRHARRSRRARRGRGSRARRRSRAGSPCRSGRGRTSCARRSRPRRRRRSASVDEASPRAAGSRR